jgi:hypothetical protein
VEYLQKRDAGVRGAELEIIVNAIRRMHHPTVWYRCVDREH